jgi:eukaryotic-like serine/threonine-protein kinase
MIGKTLAGRYHIISHLGGGSFGQTYLAEHRRLSGNNLCIVKHLQPEETDPFTLQEAKRLFYQEAKALKKLGSHDQIPQLVDDFEESSEFYLVQEYIDGQDLGKEELARGKHLSEAEVTKLLEDILEVLEFVHQQNIIHRDIKPSNLMRRRKDGKIILIDFGAVKEITKLTVASNGQTTVTVNIGTPEYMPSEQSQGHPKLCSDIYAVGMLGIQALTGVFPDKLLRDGNLEVVWRDRVQVSPALADILDKMVRYHFSQRYYSAVDALSAIKNLTNAPSPTIISLPPRTFLPTILQTMKDWTRDHKIGSMAIVVGIIGICVSIAIPEIRVVIGLEPKLSVYEEKTDGIILKYPAETWNIEKKNNVTPSQGLVDFYLKQPNTEDVSIEVGHDHNPDKTRDEYIKYAIKTIRSLNSTANILEQGTYTYANNAGYKIVYTTNENNQKLKKMEVGVLKNYQVYSITYTAKINNFDKFLPEAQKIIDSWQFVDNSK